MIVAWGPDGDDTLELVVEACELRRAPVLWLDDLPARLTLEPGARPGGTLRLDRTTVPLADVASVYLRPDPTPVADLAALSTTVCWLDLTPAVVLNRPEAMASNGSKPLQLALVAGYGFAVPETLVTTDPDEVAAFAAVHGDVVYKSTSGVRSRVSRLDLGDPARLAQVSNCPTQFQRQVHGTDYRVHVVGDDLVVTEVRSDAADYRYPGAAGTRLAPATLPADVATSCHQLAHGLGLPLAGVDLRRADDGQWYCFEVNPSPAFGYYERATGQPVSELVAGLLVAA